MTFRCLEHAVALTLLAALPAFAGCSSEEPSPAENGGSSAMGGSGPAGGSSGAASGAAGAPGGSGGTAGGATGGSAGSGVSGSAGSSPGGSGSGGASGTAGSTAGGVAGAGGAGMAGAGGAGGTGGTAGAGGRGGASGAGGAAGSAGSGGTGAFTITTPAFVNMPGCAANMAASCATIPRDNTSFGTNVSPAMTWTGAPAGTQSFAIVHQDLTNGMAHWVIWNIPASVTSVAANIPKQPMPATPAGSQQASFAQNEGYTGSGACGNVYEFVVYALSIPTFSPTQATNQMMVRMQLQALGAQILGTASMRARSLAPEC